MRKPEPPTFAAEGVDPIVKVLTEAQIAAGMTDVELCRAAGLSRNTPSCWRRNKNGPTLAGIRRALNALGYDLKVVRLPRPEERPSLVEKNAPPDEVRPGGRPDRRTDDPIMKPLDVCAELSISRATLWRWLRAGKFPEPLMLSATRIGWPRSEVHRYKEGLPRRSYKDSAA